MYTLLYTYLKILEVSHGRFPLFHSSNSIPGYAATSLDSLLYPIFPATVCILVPDPSMKLEVLKNKETFYTYEPDNLVNVSGVPVKNKNIKIKKEVLQPLQKMAKDAKEINNKTFGDMEVTAGYISYENQVSLYEEAVKKYKDEALSYTDYPGRNEAQLGR